MVFGQGKADYSFEPLEIYLYNNTPVRTCSIGRVIWSATISCPQERILHLRHLKRCHSDFGIKMDR